MACVLPGGGLDLSILLGIGLKYVVLVVVVVIALIETAHGSSDRGRLSRYSCLPAARIGLAERTCEPQGQREHRRTALTRDRVLWRRTAETRHVVGRGHRAETVQPRQVRVRRGAPVVLEGALERLRHHGRPRLPPALAGVEPVPLRADEHLPSTGGELESR